MIFNCHQLTLSDVNVFSIYTYSMEIRFNFMEDKINSSNIT